ncbi:MAG TPA: gamma-glutamyl-gamma-aminobutyrate hydrolase family protein [Microvirga sp.]
MSRPRIAVLLDENTSTGGTRYDMTKAYFTAVHSAGGSPFGIPYFPDMVPEVVEGFDGFLAVGGRFAYPDTWYVPGEISPSPASERLAVERGLMEGFIAADKPVLGLCAGMQMLACLHGGRLVPDLRSLGPEIGEHDRREVMHPVAIAPGSRLAAILGSTSLEVNSFHREALVEPGEGITVTARAPDGIIEAIERIESRFAIGLQWHQELLSGSDHPGNRIFEAFVRAC